MMLLWGQRYLAQRYSAPRRKLSLLGSESIRCCSSTIAFMPSKRPSRISRAFVVAAGDAGPAIPELMIDGRPAAAAPIKKSRRVGMTAFLRPVNFCSENRHDLQEDRSFRFCWHGRSARADKVGRSTAARSPRAATLPRHRAALLTRGALLPIPPSASAVRQNTPSLQLIGHFVDPGFDARFVLFTARRARSAGCADDLVAYLNRQRALVGYDVGEMDQA